MSRIKTDATGVYYRLDAKQQRRYIIWHKDGASRDVFETLPLGTTFQQAKAARAERVGREHSGSHLIVRNDTVADLFDEWQAEQIALGRLAPRTLVSYGDSGKHLNRILGRRRVRDITVDDIATMIETLEKEGLSKSTIKNVLVPTSRLFAYARRKRIVAVNPVQALDKADRPKGKVREIRVLTPEEIRGLLGEAESKSSLLLELLLGTGLRISEALALRWDDVDLERLELHIRRAKTEAGTRTVVITPRIAGVLRRLRLRGELGSELVVGFSSGNPFTRQYVRHNYLLPALKRAGLEDSGITLHSLRHTYASILIGQGADVTFVASQMGHSSPVVTLSTYAKLFNPEGRRDEFRTKLEQAWGQIRRVS